MSDEFGKYKVIKQLGEGASSYVYLVKSPHLDIPVALKVFKSTDNALETDFEQFKAEANLLHQLNGQPNIVSLMDVEQLADGRCFIVMPYYVSNLSQLLQNVNKLPLSIFISLIEQILTGLSSLHRRGWVHQDIKPANLLLDEQNRVYLADFGIAQTITTHSADTNQSKSRIGTPEYLCPELFNNPTLKASPVNDMFSVGVVLSKLFKKIDIKDEGLNDAIKGFIAHCMSPNMKNRVKDAQSALSSFQQTISTHQNCGDICSTKEEVTQEVNHREYLSEHAKTLIQMIRGVLINVGTITKKDRRKFKASSYFKSLLIEGDHSAAASKPLNADTLLDGLIDKVITELDTTSPNWRNLARNDSKLSKQLTRRFKRGVWASIALFLIVISMILINDFFQQDSKIDSGSKDSLLTIKESKDQANVENNITSESKMLENQDVPIFYSQISITTMPKNTDILMFNEASQVVPLDENNSAFLTRGTYTVRVSKNGYNTLNQRIDLTQDMHSFEFDLTIGDTRYFIGNTDKTVTDGIPIEFILMPKESGLSDSIRMMSHEVTNALYQQCINEGACRSYKKLTTDPRQSFFDNPKHPVVNISWFDIVERFIPWLSKHTQSTLRLPSELEWQNAAAAGSQSRFSWGDSMRNGLAHCRNCNAINNRYTMPVRQFPPNALSLFDMLGNVQEWTNDCWQVSAQTPVRCDQAVVKGGSWLDGKSALQLNTRTFLSKTARSHSTGFRLVEEVESRAAAPIGER
ncbi:bifunctional serine/threonine-protein kinase/formylglycine-generating enzyme family protein [Glaciecola sp. KUL10]|uniref:bifunctional serine/threonine-protein kinase/formylglycine-generating enzyme family protein n=1 Tax=Glaciecola sp. (strain KUL10) TaxID=2161813 RepID=UPI000D7861E9|nr:bifunctional serine/threonine-protein kinase/formylglycine-generating enzyme family protein [Glaciecola sp. KUL10]GBL05412.1 hypothetical protein KUL10_27320 [Glaciecola sp. KUL10]